MVWNLNVQLEADITTRCSANMSKTTYASMAINQRAMKKRRKQTHHIKKIPHPLIMWQHTLVNVELITHPKVT
jgi:hypothetical protein